MQVMKSKATQNPVCVLTAKCPTAPDAKQSTPALACPMYIPRGSSRAYKSFT